MPDISDIGPKAAEVPVVILADKLGTRLREGTIVRPKTPIAAMDMVREIARISLP